MLRAAGSAWPEPHPAASEVTGAGMRAGGGGCVRGLLYFHFSTAASPEESGGEQLRGPIGAMPWLRSSTVLFPSSHATLKFA